MSSTAATTGAICSCRPGTENGVTPIVVSDRPGRGGRGKGRKKLGSTQLGMEVPGDSETVNLPRITYWLSITILKFLRR